MNVALVLPAYTVDSGMAGVGVRAWELAQVLAERMPVTIVARAGSDLKAAGVRFVGSEEESWRAAIETCSAAIFFDLPDTRILLAAHRAGKLVISDNTVPIEHLEYHGIRASQAPDATYQDLVLRFRLQVLLSDHFIVRSHVARATLAATLSLIGRLGYVHYDRSAALAHLLTWVPIGFNAASATHAERAAATQPSVDFVWSGGIWDFYDPVALAQAVALLDRRGTPVTVRFLYLPPADQKLAAGRRLEEALHQLGIEHLVALHRAPLPHSERDGVVKSARAMVCIAKEGIENYTCVRLRLRDCFLYRLPFVVDRWGATGDQVRALDIGITVDAQDVEDIARGLIALADPELYRRLVANIERRRPEITLDAHVHRLAAVIARQQRAPDSGTQEHQRLVDEMLDLHPVLEESPLYPF